VKLSSDDLYREIGNTISQYLIDNNLPKVACLTNCYPNHHERKYLIDDLNYICFCASNFIQQSQFLLKLFLSKYRKIKFDVILNPPEVCLLKRQFGFVSLKCKDLSDAQRISDFVATNKRSINMRYPVLLRLICDKTNIASLNNPPNTSIEKKLSPREIILRIN